MQFFPDANQTGPQFGETRNGLSLHKCNLDKSECSSCPELAHLVHFAFLRRHTFSDPIGKTHHLIEIDIIVEKVLAGVVLVRNRPLFSTVSYPDSIG